MRILISSILLLIYSSSLFSQFTDDFSDGNYTSNPVWSGDTARFETDSLFQLHLNAPAISDVAYMSTPSNAILNAVWEFYVRLDFNPSSSNYAKIYLVSDNANLNSSLNGYYVKIGDTNDEVSLYRQAGTSSIKIIDGTDKRLNSATVTLKVKASRDSIGNWELYSDTLGGSNYYLEGADVDTLYIQPNYFGIVCNYTSTRSDKFYFDDFNVTGKSIIDTTPPVIISVAVISDTTLDIQFSEAIQQNNAETISNYWIDNSIGNPITATRDITDSSLVHLYFTTSFTNGTMNEIRISNIKDIKGNAMPNTITATFIYLLPAFCQDLVINELLFNPRTGGSDFVELYNRSEKIISIQNCQLANYDEYKDTIANHKTVTNQPFLIYPKDYVVLTKDSINIKMEYPNAKTGSFVQMDALPSYNDDEGVVILLNNMGTIVDSFAYSEDLHFALLKDQEGISLERLNFNNPTNEPSNWHSAAESVGYATPGYKNSQYHSANSFSGNITVEPEIFSPDNDGYQDVVTIHYQFEQAGYVANVIIFDSKGRKIRSLIQNELLASEGTFSWDGINEEREKSRIGIYIIYFEAHNLEGEVLKFKETCVLGSRL